MIGACKPVIHIDGGQLADLALKVNSIFTCGTRQLTSACSGLAGEQSLFLVAWASRSSAALGILIKESGYGDCCLGNLAQ